ncbi:MAG TPA: MdtA/MuxA family multidrug efflux RND transporter periplasmic adaptor subunit [Terriglobales bacterium]|nr:MdtA/MuxA family multidrug efflux RND transporter periplasmic adaptor subunit [Terriglobales bacterium]
MKILTHARIRSLLPAALFLLICAGLASCGKAASGANASQKHFQGSQTIPVSVATVERRDFPVYLTGLGSVTAFNTVALKSRVDGQLVQVAFREGREVRKGDLLAVIDPRPYQVALDQAQATLLKDESQLKNAQLDLERYKGLVAAGVVSHQQVDTQDALVGQLQGAVGADKAAIENARLNLSYCHITAPVDGRIGLRLVDTGNMVHGTDANPLLVITQLQPIAVIFTLPEDSLPVVAQHMRSGTLKVEAYNRDDQTKLTTGNLLTIDNQIDQSTGTGKLKAIFDNHERDLWPNQFVNVRLLLEVRKNATVLPAAALQRGPTGTFAYIVKANNTVEMRPVTPALTQGNATAIAQGISPGEVVVTDGQDKLQNGSKVVFRNRSNLNAESEPRPKAEQDLAP